MENKLFTELGYISLLVYFILAMLYGLAIYLFKFDSDQVAILTNLFLAFATFIAPLVALLLYDNWKGKEIYDIELKTITTINDASNYLLYELNSTTLSIKTNISKIFKQLNLEEGEKLSLETLNELDYWIFKHHKELNKFSSSFHQQLLLLKKIKTKTTKQNKSNEINLPISEINKLCMLCMELKGEILNANQNNELKKFYENLHNNDIFMKLNTSSLDIYSIMCLLSCAKSKILHNELSQ